MTFRWSRSCLGKVAVQTCFKQLAAGNERVVAELLQAPFNLAYGYNRIVTWKVKGKRPMAEDGLFMGPGCGCCLIIVWFV